MRFLLLLICIFLVGLIACNEQQNGLPHGKWVDLSYDFSSESIYWPTAKSFELEIVSAGSTEAGYYYAANNFSAAEHGGTHIDAPVHFAEGKWTSDQIPLEKLIGSAIVVDVSQKALQDRDYLLSSEDFQAWEQKHGQIPDKAIVLLRFGYGQFWPDRMKYLGTDKTGPEAVPELHFPGLHPDAAKWLVDNRNINAIGLDTPSIDYGQSKLFETHRNLYENNIPAFENVANLEQLPETGAYVFALPMKIKGGSGGPLRIVALLPESK